MAVGGELLRVEVVADKVSFPTTVTVGPSSKPMLRIEEETADQILGLDGDGDGWWWNLTVTRGSGGAEQRRVRERSMKLSTEEAKCERRNSAQPRAIL
jgi:hypothetical protein